MFTLIFLNLKVNNTLKQQMCQLSISHQLCNLILLIFSKVCNVKWNSCFLPKTWKLCLVFFTTGEIRKEVRYLMKKWKRNNFVLLKTQIFFFTEKQRTNLISNDQRIQSCTPCCRLYIFQETEPIHQFASTSSNSSNSPSGSTLKVSAMRWMSKRRENIQLRQRKNSTTNGRMRNESSDKPLNGAQKET